MTKPPPRRGERSPGTTTHPIMKALLFILAAVYAAVAAGQWLAGVALAATVR